MGVGAAAIWGLVQFSRSERWVEHTYEVLAQIERVEAEVRRAESEARAYRLTSDPAHYAQYLAAAPLVRQRADALVALVADNPAQTSRAHDIGTRARLRLRELESLIQLQRTHGAEAAIAATRSGEGARLMQALIEAESAMRDAESELLRERKQASDARARWVIGIVVVGTLLPIALLGLLMAGLSRENRRVRELEREAREAMIELERIAVRRDRLSEQRRILGTYTGLLQSCQNLGEAMALTGRVVDELLPDAGGRCYVMRASQNLVESAGTFGSPATPSEDLMPPEHCWALRRGQVHRTDTGHTGLRCAHVGPTAHSDEWTLCVPLAAHGTTLGLLHVSGRASTGSDEAQADAVESIGEQLSQTMANLQLRESLRVQSLRDPLTQLYNRRYLEENLFRELQRCERRGLPLTVMMLDVDHFKRFNDENGHAAGDALLARVGEVLVDLTRGEDIACRYGGEEFTIILPEANLEVATRRAEEIRAAIGSLSVIHMRRVLGPVTVSIGVACFPEHGGSPERLLAAADSALYRAKGHGRNRVVISAA
ncbi:sensor histidine kinase [Lysobacter bugurensis]|uniref:diguanylate cyclase n=1 Tax=Cognatilysobacter bugurensis TaxID=543356 RepID=A0A918SX17_9GAMM|nr:sensor histidine kinase [Lysobacter bugurensis]